MQAVKERVFTTENDFSAVIIMKVVKSIMLTSQHF